MLYFVLDGELHRVEGLLMYLPLIISFAVTLVIYLLRSIGVYTLATRNGVKKAWLAWVPALWIYPTCKLIGTIRIFGRPIKNSALIFTIIVLVYQVLSLTINVATYIPLIGYYMQGGNVYIGEKVSGTFAYISNIYLETARFISPFEGILGTVMTLSYKILNVLDFANIFIMITIYFDLFRKFWPEHYLLASLASIFGFFEIFVFIIRKKRAVNYSDYLRRRYGYPYNQPNGYSNGYSNGQNPNYNGEEIKKQKPENPFSEYDDKN